MRGPRPDGWTEPQAKLVFRFWHLPDKVLAWAVSQVGPPRTTAGVQKWRHKHIVAKFSRGSADLARVGRRP